MDAPGPPSDDVRALLEKDAKLRKGVLGYAYKVTHQIDEAKAASQEAMTLVLGGKGWYGWKAGGEKTLFSHLCSVVDSVVANQRARAHTRREIGASRVEEPGGPAYHETTAVHAPTVEQRAVDAEEHEEQMDLAAKVMARLDERARAMLELVQEGISDTATLADRLGCTPQEIRRARERVAHHRDAVLAEHAKKGGDA